MPLEEGPGPFSRIVRDPDGGMVRSAFHLEPGMRLLDAVPVDAGSRAAAYLEEHRRDFQLDPERDLELLEARGIGNLVSLRFQQEIQGVPVRGAVVTVNVDRGDDVVLSAASSFDHQARSAVEDEGLRIRPEISFDQAVEHAVAALRQDLRPIFPGLGVEPLEDGDRGPLLLRPSRYFPLFGDPLRRRAPRRGEGSPLRPAAADDPFYTERSEKLHLAWRAVIEIGPPVVRTLEVFVDAHAFEILGARDLLRAVVGKARVFVPDPVTRSGNPGLATTVDGQLHPPAAFDPHLEVRDLQGLDEAVGGRFLLRGELVHVLDLQNPDQPQPEVAAPEDFTFDSASPHLLATMAYYWLDVAGRHLRDRLAVEWPLEPIDVDPQALFDFQGSLYDPKRRRILLGQGQHPDAADAAVIIHELGHFIQHFQGFQGPADLEEGWADAFSRIFLDRFAATRPDPFLVFPFDSADLSDRRVDKPFAYGVSLFDSLLEPYGKGTAWASATWKVFEALGGLSADLARREWAADVTLRLHLGANVAYGTIPLPSQTEFAHHQRMAEAMLVAAKTFDDPQLAAPGLLLNVLRATFTQLGLLPPAADLRADDHGVEDHGDDPVFHPASIGAEPRVVGDPRAPRFAVRVTKTNGAAIGMVRVLAFVSRDAESCLWPGGLDPLGEELLDDWPAGSEERLVSFAFEPDGSAPQLLLAVVDAEEDPSVVGFLAPDARVDVEQLTAFDDNVALLRVTPPLDRQPERL